MSPEEELPSSALEQEPELGASSPLLTDFPIRLADVVLYDLTIERDPEQMAEFLTPGGSLHVERQQPLILGQRLEVSVAVHIRTPRQENPAITIRFRLNGVYEVTEGTSQDLIDAFVAGSIVPQIWPYARELAQSLSVRMRILPLVLPPIALQTPSNAPTQPPEGNSGNEEEG